MLFTLANSANRRISEFPKAIAIGLEAYSRWEAISGRLEAISDRLEAISGRLKAIALMLEAIAIGFASE